MRLFDDLDTPCDRVIEKGRVVHNVIRKLVPKTEGQMRYLDAIESNRVVFGHGPAGTGKAQPLDAEIQTPDGPVLMGNLGVGDEISSVDGRTTKVLAIYPQGVKQTYLLTFDDGSTTEACGEHLWSVKDHRTDRVETLSTLQISVSRTYRPDGRSRFSIQSPGVTHYPYRFPGMDSYLLGVLLGDGCIVHKPLFSSADDELVDHVQASLWSDYKVSCRRKYDYSITKGTGDGGVNYYQQCLDRMGLLGCRSHEKFIPKHILYNSVEVRLAVLQGLMDTDGWVEKNGKSQYFCTTSHRLASDVRSLVWSLGGKATCLTKTPFFTHNGEKRKGKLAYNLTIRLPRGMNAFRLSRKRDLFNGGSKYGTYRFIRDVKPHRQVECQCILVDDPSHLYLTSCYIPTHNTHLAAGSAAMALKHNLVERIVCVRPAVGAGERNGFLPGSSDEKLMPYLRPILIELQRFFTPGEFAGFRRCLPGELMAAIEIQPLEFMRGLTFKNAFIVVDEAQNCTEEQMKMIVTRLGKNSRMVVNGDETQSDLPFPARGGFRKYSEMFGGISGIDTVYMTRDDIVRDELLKRMMERIEAAGRIDPT